MTYKSVEVLKGEGLRMCHQNTHKIEEAVFSFERSVGWWSQADLLDLIAIE